MECLKPLCDISTALLLIVISKHVYRTYSCANFSIRTAPEAAITYVIER